MIYLSAILGMGLVALFSNILDRKDLEVEGGGVSCFNYSFFFYLLGVFKFYLLFMWGNK